jgi:hypothetical protein
MIEPMYNLYLETLERSVGATAGHRSTDFAELFGDATKANTQSVDQRATPADSTPGPVTAAPAAQASLADPDVQGWLTSYHTEMGDTANASNVSYQPAPGAGNNFPAGSVFGPDAIYTQALDNQIGNSFAGLTGENPGDYTSQLPGIPSQQAQQTFDQALALENAQRLATGNAIDTNAYWSDPGPVTYGGTTYSSQELGYAGQGQSSGPQPIYISVANQVQGTNTFTVPGYSGTVTGIQAGCYYTLQQLEQAGLQAGQADAQFHPGSWTLTQNA